MKTARIFLIFFLAFYMNNSSSQTGIFHEKTMVCDQIFQDFMDKWDVNGGTVAIAQDDRIIYLRAFNKADRERLEETQPYHLFRVASVSKPLTAIGILKLIEDGYLSLNDKVFGPEGILSNNPGYTNATISDDRIYDIELIHLLEHTAGWDRTVNCFPNPTTPYTWQVAGCDPIDVPTHVTFATNQDNPVEQNDYIQFLLEKGLVYAPGERYAYSNIGFLILGRIIEQVSGMDYEQWMKMNIFNPLGAYDLNITSNRLEEKNEREAEYPDRGGTGFDIYGSGSQKSITYEGLAYEQMDAHGGWIASARDLVKILFAIDGDPGKEDILNLSSLNSMNNTETGDVTYYAKGWNVNGLGSSWHLGSLPGTSGLIFNGSQGLKLAFLISDRFQGSFYQEFNDVSFNCYAAISEDLPDYDLSLTPLLPISSLDVKDIINTSVRVSWEKSDGDHTLITVSEQLTEGSFPLDGIEYNSDPIYGTGEELSPGEFVVYTGNESEIEILGLNPETQYFIKAYSYNKNDQTGSLPLYLLHNPLTTEFSTTLTTTLDLNHESSLEIFPNPATTYIQFKFPYPDSGVRIELYDLSGKLVKKLDHILANKIDISDLKAQHYYIKVTDRHSVKTGKFMVLKN